MHLLNGWSASLYSIYTPSATTLMWAHSCSNCLDYSHPGFRFRFRQAVARPEDPLRGEGNPAGRQMSLGSAQLVAHPHCNIVEKPATGGGGGVHSIIHIARKFNIETSEVIGWYLTATSADPIPLRYIENRCTELKSFHKMSNSGILEFRNQRWKGFEFFCLIN